MADDLKSEPVFIADENLVGGDLGGGSGAWNQQLFFRPFFPSFRYRMPVGRLYLCSSSTHPGAGAHGMCGWNAEMSAGQSMAPHPGARKRHHPLPRPCSSPNERP